MFIVLFKIYVSVKSVGTNIHGVRNWPERYLSVSVRTVEERGRDGKAENVSLN